MNKTTLALFALAATPVFGQIVYVNSPLVPPSSVTIKPITDAASFRYLMSNSDTDVKIGNGIFSPYARGFEASRIGWNAGGNGNGGAGSTPTLNGTQVSFVIQNTPVVAGVGGLAFYAQFTPAGGTLTTGVAGWGNIPTLSTIPPGLGLVGGTVIPANTKSAPTLVPAGGSFSVPNFAYNTLAVAFYAGPTAQAGQTISINWSALTFSGPGLTVNGAGFTPGISIVSGATGQAKLNTQFAYATTDLSKQAWQLSGKVTLSASVSYPADGLRMSVGTLNGTFSAVPEPSEYMAAVGGVALFGGLLLRRRRTEA